jgi:hypothetical protein
MWITKKNKTTQGQVFNRLSQLGLAKGHYYSETIKQ